MCKIQLQSCQIFRIFYKIHHQWQRGNERRERKGSKEDRDVGDEGRDEHEAQTVSKKRKKERAPPTSSCTHVAEDRAPNVRFDKIPIVLIEAFAGTAIVAHDFKSLANL